MSSSKKAPKILIVDDNSDNLDLLCKILSKANFQIDMAINGTDAISKVNFSSPELIILDAMMPELDGFKTCELLKKNPKTCNIPIIFTTVSTDKKKIEAFQIGANDYIIKPFQKAELLARVKSQLQVVNLRNTLEEQNRLLQLEINRKYEAEVSLLESNERLCYLNNSLWSEIRNRKKIELKLQAEILERRRTEKQIKQSLKEKNILLKEIHHRVKNSLFIVSSFLESQIEYTDDSQVIKIIENSQKRILSMALLHEQLHSKNNIFLIDFKQYLTALIDRLINSYLTKEINFQAEIQQAEVNIETAHPCGLIINEIISNIVEHAFPNTNKGNIVFKFYRDRLDNFNLFFKDDGIGFPQDKNFYFSESLGLELVLTLVEQLEGTIEMKNNNGTEIKITFKELDYKKRI